MTFRAGLSIFCASFWILQPAVGSCRAVVAYDGTAPMPERDHKRLVRWVENGPLPIVRWGDRKSAVWVRRALELSLDPDRADLSPEEDRVAWETARADRVRFGVQRAWRAFAAGRRSAALEQLRSLAAHGESVSVPWEWDDSESAHPGAREFEKLLPPSGRRCTVAIPSEGERLAVDGGEWEPWQPKITVASQDAHWVVVAAEGIARSVFRLRCGAAPEEEPPNSRWRVFADVRYGTPSLFLRSTPTGFLLERREGRHGAEVLATLPREEMARAVREDREIGSGAWDSVRCHDSLPEQPVATVVASTSSVPRWLLWGGGAVLAGAGIVLWARSRSGERRAPSASVAWE